jgi:hypothetical protein
VRDRASAATLEKDIKAMETEAKDRDKTRAETTARKAHFNDRGPKSEFHDEPARVNLGTNYPSDLKTAGHSVRACA